MTIWAPDPTNMSFEHHFGTDASSSLINHVTGGTTASLVGSWTGAVGYMDINGNAATPKGVNFGFGVTSRLATIVAVVDPNTALGIVSSSGTNAAAPATARAWFDTNPAPGQSMTLNGQAITFVASSPVGFQVVIGASAKVTALLVATLINANPGAFAVTAFCPTGNSVIELTAITAGTAGNAIGLLKTASGLRYTAAGATSPVTSLSTGTAGEAITSGLVQLSTNFTGRNAALGTGGLASLAVPAGANFYYLSTSLRHRDFPEIRLYSGGGLLARASGTTPGRTRDPAAALNAGLSGAGTGNAKIAYAGLYDGRLLSDAEDLAVYLAVQSAEGALGVTVN